jgi:hypothetical protein
VDRSPIQRLLSAVDRLDIGGVLAHFAKECRLLTVDGKRAVGPEGVREVMTDFFGGLRSTSHKVTAEWHLGDTWMAEIEASYELRNWLRIEGLPRAAFLRLTSDGISDARFYGAHEQSIGDHGSEQHMVQVGRRWIPQL